MRGHYSDVIRAREDKEAEVSEVRTMAFMLIVTGVVSAVSISSAINSAMSVPGAANSPAYISAVNNIQNTFQFLNAAMVVPHSASNLLTASAQLNALENFHISYNIALEHYIYGKSLIEVGRLDKAAETLDQLLQWHDLERLKGLYANVLFERARIHLKVGHKAEAEDLLRKAMDAAEDVRSTISMEASKIGFARNKLELYYTLLALLAEKGDWADAFNVAERAKSRALVDMLAGSLRDNRLKPAVANQEARELLENIVESDRNINLVKQVVLAGMHQEGAVSRAAPESVRFTLSNLKAKAPEVASLVTVQAATAAEVSSRLAPDEVLVDYLHTGDRLYALVLRNNSQVQGFLLDGQGLDEDIRSYRQAIEMQGGEANRLGAKLYDRLIRPLAPAVTTASLTISPHGSLHYLPFSSLHDGQAHLVDRVAFRIIPSATTLMYAKAATPERLGKLLALGNPDLNDQQLDLPSAQEEAYKIGNMFPQSKVFVRREASRATIRRFSQGYSMLHIASHGVFQADSPLSSGLMLAKLEGDSGLLSVADLYGMRLDSDLVTLSACETGLGKVASGDDVIGLTRGLFFAGVRSVVASLWKVADDATAELMIHFYTNLKQGINRRDALRKAQLETRNTYPEPFYWAAFQISGSTL
jgi:CHAT domain-containing protein